MTVESEVDNEWPTEYTKDECINSVNYRITCTFGRQDEKNSARIRNICIKAFQGTDPPIGCLEGRFLKQAEARLLLHTPSIDADMTRLLRILFNPEFHLRKEIITHSVRKGTGVWGDELGETDLAFVDYIWTATSHRKQGIASKLVQIMKEVTNHHGLKYIICFPA